MTKGEGKEIEVKIGDLPKEFHASVLDTLQHYITCLFIVDVEKKSAQACGSGTFVHVDGEHGVLTAAHVVAELQKRDKTAIFLQDGKGPLVFDGGALEYLQCESASFSESGPDIGFIRFPKSKIGAIRAIKSFANLSSHEKELGTMTHNCITACGAQLGSQRCGGAKALTASCCEPGYLGSSE